MVDQTLTHEPPLEVDHLALWFTAPPPPRTDGAHKRPRTAFIARQPIGCITRPEEVANLAVYLAGPTYTTGQIHVIDGGWTA